MGNSKRKNGLGIAGFILSLIGLVVCWVPFLNIISLVLCGLGALLCFIGLFLRNRKKGLTIVGFLFGIAGCVVFYLVYAGIAAGLMSWFVYALNIISTDSSVLFLCVLGIEKKMQENRNNLSILFVTLQPKCGVKLRSLGLWVCQKVKGFCVLRQLNNF